MNGFTERLQALSHFKSDVAGANDRNSNRILKSFIKVERILKVDDCKNVLKVRAGNTRNLRPDACRDKQPLIGKLRTFAVSVRVAITRFREGEIWSTRV